MYSRNFRNHVLHRPRLAEGARVPEHAHWRSRSLGEIVALQQAVTLAARSVAREVVGARGAVVDLQAVWVSLDPSGFPDEVPRAVVVEGGPGGLATKEGTPCMFVTGLQQRLDRRLGEYMEAVSRLRRGGVDPTVEESADRGGEVQGVQGCRREVQGRRDPGGDSRGRESKRCKGGVKEPSSREGDGGEGKGAEEAAVAAGAEQDSPGTVAMLERLDQVRGRVVAHCSSEAGILANQARTWQCVFLLSDCLPAASTLPPIGCRVTLSATLLSAAGRAQYLASCVWLEGGDEAAVTSAPTRAEVSQERREVHESINRQLLRREELAEHLDLAEGSVVAIMDDNFGMIRHGASGSLVVFDTCDLWVAGRKTAASAGRSLPSLLAVADPVRFHAALVGSSSPHYLATAVWRATDERAGVFPPGMVPLAVRMDAIHQDKIKIFHMVAASEALRQAAPCGPKTWRIPEGGGRASGAVEGGRGRVTTLLNDSFGLIRCRLH